jgi:PAS domain S-box-containing protein
MLKPSIGNQDAVFLGKALQALLATAFSHDNFGPFLEKALKIMSESEVVGPRAKLAIVLKAGRAREAYRGFCKSDRLRLAAGLNPAGSHRARLFTEPVYLGNAKAGRVTMLFPKPPANPMAARAMLGLAAQFVSARLQGEERDAELTRERDIASSVKHIEELYLSYPDISIEEISRAVMDEARRMTGSELGLAGFLDAATGTLKLAAMTREAMAGHAPHGTLPEFNAFTGLPGWVIKHKKPLLTNKAASDRRAELLPPGHARINRFLGVPALSGRKLLGMLALSNPCRDYGPGDLEAAQKLARVYAMILQRKQTDDRRREEDSRFKAIVSSTKDTIYTADLNGRLSYVSPMAAEFGYDPEELLGRSVVEFSHPDDKEFIVKAWANAVKTGRTLPILPYRLKRKDGSYAYVEQKSGIVFNGGKPQYITGVLRDVTEMKYTERLLKQSEALMRMVFDTAPDPIFIKDMNGMYVKVNKACADLMGVTPEEMIGRTDADYLGREAAENVFRTDSEVARTGKPMSLNNLHPFPTGSRYVNVIKTPLKSAAGETIGLLGIARDITELKRMETELAAERAAEAVSKVARPMAHDFNNALAAINGYATLIDDGLAGDNPIKTEIAQIIKAVERAAELMSRFQDFARNPDIRQHEDKEKK